MPLGAETEHNFSVCFYGTEFTEDCLLYGSTIAFWFFEFLFLFRGRQFTGYFLVNHAEHLKMPYLILGYMRNTLHHFHYIM